MSQNDRKWLFSKWPEFQFFFSFGFIWVSRVLKVKCGVISDGRRWDMSITMPFDDSLSLEIILMKYWVLLRNYWDVQKRVWYFRGIVWSKWCSILQYLTFRSLDWLRDSLYTQVLLLNFHLRPLPASRIENSIFYLIFTIFQW